VIASAIRHWRDQVSHPDESDELPEAGIPCALGYLPEDALSGSKTTLLASFSLAALPFFKWSDVSRFKTSRNLAERWSEDVSLDIARIGAAIWNARTCQKEFENLWSGTRAARPIDAAAGEAGLIQQPPVHGRPERFATVTVEASCRPHSANLWTARGDGPSSVDFWGRSPSRIASRR
jgi:hypothetical protein